MEETSRSALRGCREEAAAIAIAIGGARDWRISILVPVSVVVVVVEGGWESREGWEGWLAVVGVGNDKGGC